MDNLPSCDPEGQPFASKKNCAGHEPHELPGRDMIPREKREGRANNPRNPARQSPSYKIQPRKEWAPKAAASQSSGRSEDHNSLMSVLSVNSEFMSQNFCYRFAIPSKRKVLSPIFASLSKAEVGSFSNWK